LRQKGLAVALIERASLQTPKAIAAAVSREREKYGPVAGIVHLAALSQEANPTTLSEWRQYTQIQAKSLFSLLQLCADDLCRGQQPGRVLMASCLGGQFGRDGNWGTSLAIAGCGNGLLKTLAAEWPNLYGKAVDLDSGLSPSLLAECLMSELLLPGGRIEVGYPQGQRTIFRTLPAPFSSQTTVTQFTPTPDWVVLITGGARGITAEITSDLASFGLNLILVGRAPLENEATSHIEDVAGLRQFLLAQARSQGKSPTPVEIERQIQLILREQEVRSNLARFRQAGAKVEYLVADVKDEEAFAAVIKGIYSRYGRLDAAIHGAGIIEDKLIVDKELTSFERVFDTKVDSAFILSRYLRPESLKWLVFFSSVAGRYGNRGQSDYASANEILNRLAWQLDQLWLNTRVVAINWGPWDTKGMASEEVKRQFRERGIIPIGLAAGRQFFWEELSYGDKGTAEVIAGEAPWENHEAEAGKLDLLPAGRSFPFISSIPQLQPDSKVTLEHIFSLEEDPYLEDHCLDGKAVLPATGALEWIAEFTQAAWPDWKVCEIVDLRVLRGVSMAVEGNRKVLLVARSSSHADASTLQVSAEIVDPETQIPFYRAHVILRPEIEAPPSLHPVKLKSSRSLDPQFAYLEYLFHGRRFQLMSEIIAVDEGGIDAWVNLSKPSAWVKEDVSTTVPPWLFDPGFLDTIPQMALVWSRLYQDSSALPSRFGRVIRYGNLPLTGRLRVAFRVVRSDPQMIVYEASVFDEQGQVRFYLENLESTCSAALNRLNVQWRQTLG
jgi:NAD(P)-dependent dehydrogenase (short-subunit alcohol dehydrogenase family)